MSPSPLSGLSEAERDRALERFQLLQPFLEDGVPLRRLARERGLALRTARRWVALDLLLTEVSLQAAVEATRARGMRELDEPL